GAQVALSSTTPAVALVPGSVTVPAGATSTIFTVTTSPVAATTAVTISASYGGVTQGAALTVTPPPLPTLSSLTLRPTSVIGGLNSSHAPALHDAPPLCGAHVALSSTTPAVALVPGSVTVPAGAINATFTVTTFAVATSTSVSISASYGG